MLKLAEQGLKSVVKEGGAIAKGVNTLNGHVTYQAVAEAIDVEYVPIAEALAV